MRRREFIAALGAAALPLSARAQQSAKPVVGFLRPTRAEESGQLVAAFREGLRESGYPSDKVAIEFRWGDGREEQLPKLASELVTSQVAAILAASLPSARAAKTSTATIPIVFVTGGDPQEERLVSSLNRPGANITGVSFYDIPITGKRLALLRELLPKAETIAVLQDPTSATFKTESREIDAAVRASGQKVIMVKAGTEQEINQAFSTITKSGADALLVGGGPFLNSKRNQVIGLAALNAIPASYVFSEFGSAGGLVSYGASQTDAYRRAGAFVARVLNGEKPGDIPVELPTRFELAINLKTAKALGLIIPPSLLARADEVIE